MVMCTCKPMVRVRPEHPGEAGLPGEEHAGQTAFRTFHHRETRSVVHWAVDRRIRLPKPCQVRGFKSPFAFLKVMSSMSVTELDLIAPLCLQAAGVDQPTERGHREAEETPGQEETSVVGQLPNTNHQLWAKATQNQGRERSGERSLLKTQSTSAVSSGPGLQMNRISQRLILRLVHKRMFETPLTKTNISLHVCLCGQADTSRVPWTGRDL